jgi:serine/threonine protein kinase
MLIGGAPFKGVDYNTMVSRVASGEMFQSLNVSPFAKNLLSRMICVDMRQRITTNELLTILERNKPNSSIITSPNRREQSPRPTA